jgi:hypothetical protein
MIDNVAINFIGKEFAPLLIPDVSLTVSFSICANKKPDDTCTRSGNTSAAVWFSDLFLTKAVELWIGFDFSFLGGCNVLRKRYGMLDSWESAGKMTFLSVKKGRACSETS